MSDLSKVLTDMVGNIIPKEALLEIVHRFEIGQGQLQELCSAIQNANLNVGTKQEASIDAIRKRQALFAAALEQFKKLPKGHFVEREGVMQYMPEAVVRACPDTVTFPDAIAPTVFENMVCALIAYGEFPVRLLEAEESDRKALGNRTNIRRHAFWFGLLTFWYHELGRPLTITTNPITGQPGGHLVEFLSALSAHHLADDERTPMAIAGFIRRNKMRAINDPNFGINRIMSFW
ncbi:hypothetical protein [Mesorhizobium sp. Root157]|uniref:hypothetical protein n=1 Tax=Mesorhizobium sp. Root157 TaxID=1736477 RepID=UPI0012E3A035|nr:hypothetical protein [Mesorhizobium sp. Root157]